MYVRQVDICEKVEIHIPAQGTNNWANVRIKPANDDPICILYA